MKIVFSTSVAGENFSFRRKREYELPRRQARVFIKAGQAKEVKVPRGGKVVETAMRPGAPETR